MTVPETAPVAPAEPAVELDQSSVDVLQEAFALMTETGPSEEPVVEAAPGEAEAPEAVPPETKDEEYWKNYIASEMRNKEKTDKLRSLESMKTKNEEMEALKLSDPVAWAEAHGVPFEMIANRVIADAQKPKGEEKAPEVSPEQNAMADRLKQLEAMVQKQTNDKHFAEYKQTISTAMEGEDFALVRAFPNGMQLATDLSVQRAHEGLELLQPTQILGMVQERLKSQLLPLFQNEPLRAALGLSAPESVPSAPVAVPAPPARTLTNNMKPGYSSSPDAPMSTQQVLDEAVKHLL